MSEGSQGPRAATFAQLSQEILDLLIIGGGVVGAAIARDAAMRGLRTGLIEQRDFASGTSSHTSRLLHGGLRYLAQGRLGLVREASIEKKTIYRIAPHLAQPLEFTFPTYRGTPWPLWKLRAGVKIYDVLCGGQNFGRSGALSSVETLKAVPGLNGENLTGAVKYYDALTSDARLVFDTLNSAVRHGAQAINYCRFENASRESESWKCQVEDKLEGRETKIRARVIVNATGPWAQGLPHSGVRLRATKGAHLVLSAKRLPVATAVVLSEGKRILFVIPWGERVIAGTTDTEYEGRPEDVRVEKADVEYLLRIVNEFFPGLHLNGKDIVSSFAGVRPLIADSHGGASDISRAHQIRSPEPHWWDVAGGKLTTCRLMAEQTVDRVTAGTRFEGAPCRTAAEPLLEGGARFSGIVPPEFGRTAVEHFCSNEWAVHLDDVMIRRAGWHYYLEDAAASGMEVSQWMKEICGWPEKQRHAELSQYETLVNAARMW
jgi:glycerol-3-phosphate dehydrogenase